MDNRKTNTQPTAVVIGEKTDEFVHGIIALLIEYDVEFVLAETIYQAAAKLAALDDNDLIFFGRAAEMTMENGAFLKRINELSCPCCCLTEGEMPDKGFDMFLIGDIKDAETFLSNCREQKNESQRNSKTFNKNEFLTTQEELDALLDNGDG